MVLDSFVANTSVQIVRCAPWGVKKMVVLRFEFFRENAMVDFQECESEEARQIITDILMKNYKGITIVGDNRLLNIPIKRITYANRHAQERQCIFYERTEEERIQDKIDRVKNQLKQYA